MRLVEAGRDYGPYALKSQQNEFVAALPLITEMSWEEELLHLSKITEKSVCALEKRGWYAMKGVENIRNQLLPAYNYWVCEMPAKSQFADSIARIIEHSMDVNAQLMNRPFKDEKYQRVEETALTPREMRTIIYRNGFISRPIKTVDLVKIENLAHTYNIERTANHILGKILLTKDRTNNLITRK